MADTPSSVPAFDVEGVRREIDVFLPDRDAKLHILRRTTSAPDFAAAALEVQHHTRELVLGSFHTEGAA